MTGLIALSVLAAAGGFALGMIFERWMHGRRLRRDFGDFMETAGPESMTSPSDFIENARRKP